MISLRLLGRIKHVNGVIGHGHRSMSFISGSKLDAIKTEFRNHVGGRIFLTKCEEMGIAFICLDYPEKRNAVSGNMMVQLHEAIEELEKWKDGKAVVLHSSGDSFSSGGYKESIVKILGSEGAERMCSLMHDSVQRLADLPFPSVAVVRGKAVGGGAELAVATDFRLFTPSAKLRFVEARMGISTGWGGAKSLQRLVGRSQALYLLLSGSNVDAEEARRIGLADEVLSSDENSLEEATQWILNLVHNFRPNIVQANKQVVACCNNEREKEIFAKLWGGEDHVRALSKNIKHN